MLAREYKELNIDIRPDQALVEKTRAEMLQTQRRRSGFRPKWIVCCGVGALALVLTVTIALTTILLPGGIQTLKKPLDVSSSESASPDGTEPPKELNTEIPDWYKPGRLRVTTLSGSDEPAPAGVSAGYRELVPQPLGAAEDEADTGQSADELKLPDGYQIDKYSYWVGEDYISVLPVDEQGEHGECYHIYYNQRTEELVCMNHLAQEKAEEAELVKSGYIVGSRDGNPETGECFIDISDKNQKFVGRYAAASDGTITPLPFKNPDKNMVTFAFSSDHRYYAYIERNGSYRPKETVWLVELDGEGAVEVADITKAAGRAYETGENARFAPGGRFLIYNVLSDDGKLYHDNAYEDWVVYDTETGKAFRGRGEFLRYIRGGSAAVVESPEGIKVLELATGEDITASAELSDTEQVRTEYTAYYKKYGDAGRLTLKSCFDEKKEEKILREHVSAYYEKDGFLYLYTHGEQAVECYSLETGKSFYRLVSQEWLTEIAASGHKGTISYAMTLNSVGTEVLLTYDTLLYETTEQSDEHNFIAWFQWSDSLVDMERFIKLAPEDSLEATYKLETGDGFIALTFMSAVTPTRPSVTSYTAVEDYRDKTFTLYQYPGENMRIYKDNFLSPNIPFRKQLSDEASQEKTQDVFREIITTPAALDYRELYTNGDIDPVKARRYELQRLLDTRPANEVAMTDLPLRVAGDNYETQ